MTDPDPSVPIACSLGAGAVREREREWSDVLSLALISRTPVAGGVRLQLRALPGVGAELDRLVAAETDCCPFLTMSTETVAASIELTVTAPTQAAPILERLLAAERE